MLGVRQTQLVITLPAVFVLGNLVKLATQHAYVASSKPLCSMLEILSLIVRVAIGPFTQACQVGKGFSVLAVLQLRQLNISNNRLTGTLPSSWGNLTKASTMR